MADIVHPGVYRCILDSLHLGVYLLDLDRRILYWNDAAERITGFLRHEVLGRRCRDSILSHCDESGCGMCGQQCPTLQTMIDARTRQARVYLQHKDGHRVRVQVWASPIRDENGTVIGAVESFEEARNSQVSGRREQDLTAHGCTDAKTGLSNHSFTEFHLRESLSAFEQYGLPFSVLLVEIQEIRELTAKYSREGLHAILRSVAESLENAVGPGDFVGRWMDNRFLAILPSCNPADASRLQERVRQVIAQSTIHWWGDPLSVTAACGTALVNPGDSVESLVQRAETSLLRSLSSAPEHPLAKSHKQGTA